MKTTSFRARALACALLATTATCGLTAQPAQAQAARQHRALDANGVDLIWGDFLMSFVEGSIGSGEAELGLVRNGVWALGFTNTHQWDRITFQQSPLSGGGARYVVGLGARSEIFDGTGSLPTGSSLAGSGASFTYRTADGSEVEFVSPIGSGPNSPYCNGTQTSCSLLATNVTSPDGKTVSLAWDIWTYCWGMIEAENEPCTFFARLAGVSNSFGYEIRFAYSSDGAGGSSQPPQSWYQRTGATFHNNEAGSSALASTSYSYPSTGVTEVIDMGGRVWRFTGNSANVTAIRRPGASSDTTSVSYGTSGSVTSVTDEGVTTDYSRSVSGSLATTTVTNALSQVSSLVSDLTIGRPTSVTDPLSHTTAYQYDTSGRLTRVTAPEGNYVEHSYDARGNVTQTQAVPKGGTGPTIVTSASYDATCSNPLTCNQPNSTTDVRGNVTDYTYDSTHGGVLTVTGPAPSSGAARPQTRYSYTLSNGEYRLTGVSICQTAASCAGTADEAKTTIAYDSNGNATSTSSGAGDNSLVATSAMSYDALGNLLTVDGPLAGSADTARIRYDAARQVIGAVSPDPDGAGALKHRAVRNTYTDGLLTRTEQGNVNSQSDTDWAAFSAAQAVETGYDAYARPVTGKLVAGSTVYALSQTGYDALGRPECTAQRMNPAEFGSLPGDACTLDTQGSYGPDRIVKTLYDAAGQVTQVKTALGVSGEEANKVTATYTANGLPETVTDAENNKTTYEYDGHDRLAKTRFPDTTKGAGTSSTSDYEQPTYENLAGGTRTSGFVTAFRNRANQTIGFGYDALGRQISKDLPGSEPDAAYGYDLLGRTTSAVQNGITIGFTWDTLGRQLTQTIPIASIGSPTFSSQYDLAGRRTRLTWPVDASGPTAYYVDYDYLVTGDMLQVRERGATSGAGVLATFGYDDLGRRTSLTRGNGTVTSYGYDAVSRLSQLSHDFAGTTHDLTLTFAYNPASQIVSTTRSNDLYAWNGHGSGTTASTADGLNRLASHGGATPAYDARGNMTSDGTSAYTYTSENLLASAGASGTLDYDPLMRFYRNYTTYFIHDTGSGSGAGGGQLIGEYYNGSIVNRYVPGPGVDEPLVSVGKTGARTWFHADERGSVIAASDGAGANARIILYDENGKRGSGGSYRFAFTGQVHLLNDVYDYKSRNYNARLSRFLQTDPIGYGGGMNLYAAMAGDPVNFGDPTGLCRLANGDWFDPPTGSHICPGGGGGSFGGGGATESWDLPLAESDNASTNQIEIVVTASWERVRAILRSAPPNKITYGHPPDDNSRHHISRHLGNLTTKEKNQLFAHVASQIRSVAPHLRPGQQYIGIVVFMQREYEFHAFGLPNDITNVGTIFDVTE